MRKNNKLKLLLFSLFSFLIFKTNVNAAVGTMNIPGATLNVGDTKTVQVTVSKDIMAADGTIVSNDPSCLQIVKGGGYFIKVDYEGNNISTVATVTVKGLKACSTTLKVTNASLTAADGSQEDRNLTFTSGTFTVKEKATPKPSNSNTTSNKPSNTTSNKPSNTTSNKTSNTTSNKKSNTTSDITSNVSKKSDNNFLSALGVVNYAFDKKFSSTVTSYSILVGDDVNSINIDAKASDSKSKVVISGADSLKPGKNTARVTVIAENGDKRTYTIIINKEDNSLVKEEPKKEVKGDEEVLEKNSDNNLLDIKPSAGILSPKFDKDVTKYIIYVPYEVDNISFNAILSNENAKLEVPKISDLKNGDNKIVIKVTATDGSEKEYVVIVKRGINPQVLDNSNSYLKSLKINNGSITTEFNKETYDYYYKGNNIEIDALAEDENANINIVKNGKNYYVYVESPSGEASVYTLKPYNKFDNIIVKSSIIVGTFICGFVTKMFIKKKNR